MSMATVHPSRMLLVPQDSLSSSRYHGRSPSPRRRGRSPDRRRDESRRPHNGDNRRASPDYDEYKDPPRNMYRTDGIDYLESRRLQREAMTANAWPSSPKTTDRSLSPTGKSKHKSKRSRSYSSDESSSEEERHRTVRKEKKRRKGSETEGRRRRRRSRSYHSDDDDDRRQRRRTKSRSTSLRRHRSSPDNEWVVKPTASNIIPTTANTTVPPDDSDSDEGFGPQPAPKVNTSRKVDERSYGGALLRGEGSAMAAFLQEGGTEARIPRRGEIGLSPDEIAKYEQAGYVMSGNRHRRMNAVRIRKENQVISAEEKRGILKLQKEERQRREAILREEFSELVSEKLSKT